MKSGDRSKRQAASGKRQAASGKRQADDDKADNREQQFLEGIVRLAARHGVPIVPVGIVGPGWYSPLDHE